MNQAISSLSGLLHAGNFAVTAEIAPPASGDPQALLARALPLRGLADAVNVTDGAQARASMSALAAAAILAQNGIEPILQLSCRDRNRIALQSDLLGASALGIRNLLMLRGDDPTAGDQPDTKPVFDLDTEALVATAVAMRDRGELPSGRALLDRPDFFIGATDAPLDPPPGWKPDKLKAKVEAGVQFVQTQFCMDVDVLKRYLRASPTRASVGVCRSSSASRRSPPRSRRSGCARTCSASIIADAIVRAHGAGERSAKAEGRRICVELMHELERADGHRRRARDGAAQRERAGADARRSFGA